MNNKTSLFLIILNLILLLCVLVSIAYFHTRLSNIENILYKQLAVTKPITQQNSIPIVYKSLIDDFIRNNIEEIVNEEHLTGGKWIITNQIYLSANTIRIDYEDGHQSGQLIFLIEDVKGDKIKYKILWKLE